MNTTHLIFLHGLQVSKQIIDLLPSEPTHQPMNFLNQNSTLLTNTFWFILAKVLVLGIDSYHNYSSDFWDKLP